MKNFKKAVKYGTGLAVVGTSSVVMAVGTADPDLLGAATTAIENGAATSKGVFLLYALGLAVIIAVTWGIAALRSSKR